MNMMKREDGQSVIMIVAVLVVLIALVALVVDIGNAYAQRRIAQNAADAAALAATRELALGDATTNRRVLNEAKQYAELNGIDPETVQATYFDFDPDTQTRAPIGPVTFTADPPPSDADGVNVDVGKSFSSFFAQVIGRDEMAASAESNGQVSRGACISGESTGVYPFAIDDRLLRDGEGQLQPPEYGQEVTLYGGKNDMPNFRWLTWNSSKRGGSELVLNMNDPLRSGVIAVEDELWRGPKTKKGAFRNKQPQIEAQMDLRIGSVLLVPIYTYGGSGWGDEYPVSGFGAFVVTDYSFNWNSSSQSYPDPNDRKIVGYFTEDVIVDAEGGCLDFGTTTVKLRPPLDLTRNIAGRIAYEYLKVDEPSGQTTFPVDVALVIDTSGSMEYRWGAEQVKKIATARSVLSDFVGMLRPDIGDQVGLVKFPKVVNGPSYRARPCSYSWHNKYYYAETLSELTTDMAYVDSRIAGLQENGGTPVALAMEAAIDVLENPDNHIEGHPQILIVASDGMGNIKLDGKWGGWSGSGGSEPGCNEAISEIAINMANQAKAAGMTVFTIAIGDDFLSYVLEAMASPDPDPEYPHFFTASNPTAMQDIYDSLGERIIDYGGECTITPLDSAADGALVRLYKDGALVAETYADDAGNFSFLEVEPGVYTFDASFERDGIIYDVFTNMVGGVELDSPPTIEVGQDAGTYSIHLALKTSTPPHCEL